MLTILVVFFAINKKKPINKSVEPASLSKMATNDTFRVRPLTNIKYERTAERLKRGQYLTAGLLQCFTCHSPRNWKEPGAPPIAEKIGSGGTILVDDSTTFAIAPNITPDKETGAGTWTDDMLGRAIREGVGHDGRALFWQMPSSTFRNLSDDDLASVIVYLRSIPAVHNVVRSTRMPKELRSGIERSLNPIIEPVKMPDLTDSINRGRYLVRLGECVGCHTSHAEYNPGIFAGGNDIERFALKAFSANITSDESGIPYGPEGFIFVLRTGKGGLLSPIMPWISFKNMNDEDLRAIYSYLRTFPSAKHFVSSQLPFTHCAICGLDHGLGNKNKRDIPAGIKLNLDLYDQYAGTYLDEQYGSTYIISKERNKLLGQPWENGPKTELIPQSELSFIVPGWVLPVSFVKDKDGRVSQLVEGSDYGRTFKKIK
jgi:mono/diheme cytochrome c family protein